MPTLEVTGYSHEVTIVIFRGHISPHRSWRMSVDTNEVFWGLALLLARQQQKRMTVRRELGSNQRPPDPREK
jgi:hypothetical protein